MSSPSGTTPRPGAPIPFGPFLLDRRIAVGGTAEVFLARPKRGTRPAERLVVKRLLPLVREESDFAALEREAELHQAVHHPNVVQVYGAGMVGDEPFIALEYVDGVDVYRLLRRCETDGRQIPTGVAVHIVRRVADALASVHTARDAKGRELHIVHRDITPSNVYLSTDGDVKVGDFGIARASVAHRPAAQPQPSVGLKGKFGYLAPEQVAGEPFDHRADLFSLSAVLGELLIGQRVFPGSGQLAVLLAIRDGNIEPLEARAHLIPTGLYDLCRRGLARHPDDRFATAAELRDALAPWEQPGAEACRQQVGELVVWARDSSRLARTLEGRIRDSVERMRAVRSLSDRPEDDDHAPSSEGGAALSQPAEARSHAPGSAGAAPLPPSAGPQVVLSELSDDDPLEAASFPPVHEGSLPSVEAPGDARATLRRAGSHETETVPLPRLLELIATGELGGEDEVAIFGVPFRAIAEIEELSRHLLPSTATTMQMFEPGAPDFQEDLAQIPLIDALARLRRGAETGVLFVLEGENRERRKEIYLLDGRLHHVASSDRGELLGEYLVRRGALRRSELDVALNIVAANGGRLGDTLVTLGVVSAVDIFRAIRDQGRDRVASACGWTSGRAIFYRGTTPAHVEFPLDLDLASPMMAGAIVMARGEPRALLPADDARMVSGRLGAAAAATRERGTAPASLQLIPRLLPEQLTVRQAIERLVSAEPRRGGRRVGDKEACAALHVAEVLEWVKFE